MSFLKAHLLPFAVTVLAVVVGVAVAPKVLAAVSKSSPTSA